MCQIFADDKTIFKKCFFLKNNNGNNNSAALQSFYQANTVFALILVLQNVIISPHSSSTRQIILQMNLTDKQYENILHGFYFTRCAQTRGTDPKLLKEKAVLNFMVCRQRKPEGAFHKYLTVYKTFQLKIGVLNFDLLLDMLFFQTFRERFYFLCFIYVLYKYRLGPVCFRYEFIFPLFFINCDAPLRCPVRWYSPGRRLVDGNSGNFLPHGGQTQINLLFPVGKENITLETRNLFNGSLIRQKIQSWFVGIRRGNCTGVKRLVKIFCTFPKKKKDLSIYHLSWSDESTFP